MWLSYGLSGGGYPDVGYPMGCPGGLSGWGLSGWLSGRIIWMWVIAVFAFVPTKMWVIGCVVRKVLSRRGLSGGFSGRVIRMSVILAVYPGVGYPGTRRVFGRWTTGDLIPKSPLRRGYLIWRLILVVACTLSRSKFALSDLI